MSENPLKPKLINIANFSTTHYEGKKHGGFNIYEDDKIKIYSDTYYPNVSVYLKINGENKLVLLESGHGYTQEYHSGAWENYVSDVLYPKSIEARKIKEEAGRFKKFGPIDDKALFS